MSASKWRLMLLVALTACAPRPQPLTILKTRSDERLMVVPITIGGSPQWFAWDSGAPSLVIDPRLARELRLKTGAHDSVRGTGTGPVPILHAAPAKSGSGIKSS